MDTTGTNDTNASKRRWLKRASLLGLIMVGLLNAGADGSCNCTAPPPPPGDVTKAGCSVNGGLDGTYGDLALFAISFHHGARDGNVPFPDEIESVAAMMPTLWPHPENMVIVLPNNPPRAESVLVPFCGYGSDCHFFEKLKEAYGGHEFQWAHSDDGYHGAVIVGSSWTVKGTNRSFSPAIGGNYDEYRYGMFTVTGSAGSFNVFNLYAWQELSEEENQSRYAKAVTQVIDYAKADHGDLSSFIVGDTNHLDLDPALHEQLVDDSTWYTCRSDCKSSNPPCDAPQGLNPYSPEYIPPELDIGKINVLEIPADGTRDFDPRYILFNPNSFRGWITFPTLLHTGVAAIFTAEAPM